MLFKRYACPFVLLNQVIEANRFNEFINELMRIYNRDTENETLWELYLHHGFIDKTFKEFKEQIGYGRSTQNAPVNLEATVSESMDILQGFVPEE